MASGAPTRALFGTDGVRGVANRDLTPELVESFHLPVTQGVLIAGVLQDGPASAAGLRPGDVVTRIDGKPVASTAALLKAVAALKPQTRANVAVQRGDKALELAITIGQRPPGGNQAR